MYTMRISGEQNLGTAKTLNEAVMKIHGVYDGVVVHLADRRLVAYWDCTKRVVCAGFGADELERKSLGAS